MGQRSILVETVPVKVGCCAFVSNVPVPDPTMLEINRRGGNSWMMIYFSKMKGRRRPSYFPPSSSKRVSNLREWVLALPSRDYTVSIRTIFRIRIRITIDYGFFFWQLTFTIAKLYRRPME
ncbi:hypothetical protein AA313_de0209996 [Arthrobotrys entomopaga]|nr:hypothetical protein AA313_de0209996 [Arthrobotrys entomopaga]